MFAQLEPRKVRDASVFLGLAQGEAFPCALGVDWLGCAKPRSDTSTGRLEKNQRQQQGIWKGCMSQCIGMCQRWVLGASLELSTSCLQSDSGSAAVSHPSRYHFPPSCLLEHHQPRQCGLFLQLRLPQSSSPGTHCRVAPLRELSPSEGRLLGLSLLTAKTFSPSRAFFSAHVQEGSI